MKRCILFLALIGCTDDEGKRPAFVYSRELSGEGSCESYNIDYWKKNQGFNFNDCKTHMFEPKYKVGQKVKMQDNPKYFFKPKARDLEVGRPVYLFYSEPVKAYYIRDSRYNETILERELDRGYFR